MKVSHSYWQTCSSFMIVFLLKMQLTTMPMASCSANSTNFDFIESCLRHKSEMVIYEAAHAIVNMRNTTAKDLAPAVSVLQLFCSSPKPTLRFAAARTLNKVELVSSFALGMECKYTVVMNVTRNKFQGQRELC